MRFSYMLLYTFLVFFCSINPALCAGEERLSDEELLDKHSKLFSLPPFPVKKFFEENRSSFNDRLKTATELKTIDELPEADKQQLCWKCLLYMKDLYKGREETAAYAYAYLNMAKFLLNTGIYPNKAYKRERSNNKQKLFHSRLITKIAKIVKGSESGEKDKIYKWSRIYMALLSMDYADKYEHKQESKEEQLARSYRRLLEAKEVKSTKTVNFYLAKLILDPKFQYIPPGLDRKAADIFARQCLSGMVEGGERQPFRRRDVGSDDRREKTLLYPIKSAQPAYLRRGRTRLSVQESSNEEEGGTASDVNMGPPPSIVSASLDSDKDQDDAEHRIVPFSSSISTSMDLTIEDNPVHQERKQNESEYRAVPPSSIILASSDSNIRLYSMLKEPESGLELGANLSLSSASRSSGMEDELKDKDQDDSQQGMESKVSASKSLLTPSREILGGSGPLKKALEEATKAKKITESLEQELKNKYPHPKNPTTKDLGVVRLVLCIKECEGLSQKKIAEHILLKEKVSHSLVSSILKGNGVKSSVVGFTEQRKQELLVPYMTIKARAGKDARLRVRDIARTIAQGLGYAEEEIIWQLEALMNDRSQQDTPSEHQKKTVCNLYKGGKTYPEIKEKTKLSFVAITQIILEKIPTEELVKDSSIILPQPLDRNSWDKEIVQVFRDLTTPKGPPTVAEVMKKTGYGRKICGSALTKAGLVKEKKTSKHLSNSKKQEITKFWQEQMPLWDQVSQGGKKKITMMKDRYQETADKFEATVTQIKGVINTHWSKNSKKDKPQEESASELQKKPMASKKGSKPKNYKRRKESENGSSDKGASVKKSSKRRKN